MERLSNLLKEIDYIKLKKFSQDHISEISGADTWFSSSIYALNHYVLLLYIKLILVVYMFIEWKLENNPFLANLGCLVPRKNSFLSGQ